MASRYWIGGGTSTSWNASPTTNWAATSGDTVRVAAPTVADDVFFDGVGTNANTNSNISTSTIKSLTIGSGYTAAISHSAILTVNGNITLSTNYTVTGSSGIVLTGSCTINTNGKVWPNNIAIGATSTIVTISGSNLVMNGTWNQAVNIQSVQLNRFSSEIVTIGNGISLLTNGALSGSAPITVTGGTIAVSSAPGISNNLNLSGSVTIGTTFNYSSGLLTYQAGSITTAGSTLSLGGTTTTLNTSGMTWNNITLGGTTTLTSNLNLNGTLTNTGINTIVIINKTTNEIVTTGGLSQIATNAGYMTGSADITLTSGSWTGNATNPVYNNLNISGSITLSTNVSYRGGTLKYITGTVTTAGSTLNLLAACTLDTNGMTWDTVIPTTGTTLTLNSLFACTTFSSSAAALTFGGSGGFSIGTYNWTTAATTNTLTLTAGNTYIVTNAFTATSWGSGAGFRATVQSSSGTTRANLTLSGSATTNTQHNFTRIDASGGNPIFTWNGTVTDSPNVIVFGDKKSIGIST
tara:strand:+ start:2094 stop:3659 length:1566 start_codon:yes stop_codon:yes gene_type:complete